MGGNSRRTRGLRRRHPLIVLGLYDSHFLGSLYTLGAETRTYGNAPPGGVAWFRAPRFKEGKHFFNFEVWRDNRVRSLYEQKDEEIGRIYGSALAFNADYLLPVNASWPHFQLGARYSYLDQQIIDWDKKPEGQYDLSRLDLAKERTRAYF